MPETIQQAVREILEKNGVKLSKRERRVLQSILKHETISRDVHRQMYDERTLGEKVADRVATFGGSWTFIFIFGGVLLSWIILNSLMLANRAFDPYPYILLNLFLSMLAAIQAPIIMMSQNRQAAKDRETAKHDYEVNLKSELEIRRLHEKMDELREDKWIELIKLQQEQINLLEELATKKTVS
jgi:uncharacterized membrane protein